MQLCDQRVTSVISRKRPGSSSSDPDGLVRFGFKTDWTGEHSERGRSGCATAYAVINTPELVFDLSFSAFSLALWVWTRATEARERASHL